MSETPPSNRKSPPSAAAETLRTVLLALLLAFGVRIGVAQAYVVDGPSMEPTLFQDERLFVARCAYGLSIPFVEEALLRWAEPDIGDVVVVQSPADGLDLVKRVVGLPGDVVEVRDGVVFRNGEAADLVDRGPCPEERQTSLDPECHLYEESVPGAEGSWIISRSALDLDNMPPFVVPAGQVFVMGDHRDRSNDSRYFGSISLGRLRGRVLFVD